PSASEKRATAPTLSGRIPAISLELLRAAAPNRLMVAGGCVCAAAWVALPVRIKASAIGSTLALGIAQYPSAADMCPVSHMVARAPRGVTFGRYSRIVPISAARRVQRRALVWERLGLELDDGVGRAGAGRLDAIAA